MAKVIDLMSNREKTKVSLALNKETVDLIDNAVNGFRTIYTLLQVRNDLDLLKSTRTNLSFNNVISRSEILDEFIVGLSTEKVFKVKDSIYSLSELSEIFEKFCLDISLYGNIQISDCLKVKDPEKTFRYYLSAEQIQEDILGVMENCKDETWEMTLNYYPDLFEEIEFELVKEIDITSDNLNFDLSIRYHINTVNEYLNVNQWGSNAGLGEQKKRVFNEMLAFVVEHQKSNFTSDLRARILKNLLFNEKNDTSFNVVEEAYNIRNSVDKCNYLTFTAKYK